jgi:DNA repair photolyase
VVKIIKEIEAKTLLLTTKNPDFWFNVRYNMNIYRGCEHKCIYCDSRSECYHIDNFDDVLVKVNAPELIAKELSKKRIKGIIGTGAMSDPYTYAEKKYNLTGRTLEIIAEFNYPVHIITKSDLILKDLNTLIDINRASASVAFTLTTCDDILASKIEPNAPSPSRRLTAMKALARAGIYTGVTMMPILPFVEDNEENIRDIVKKTAEAGGKFIMPGFGVTLRDRQRAYFYKNLDIGFKGIKENYKERFGDTYQCQSDRAHRLKEVLMEEASKHNILTNMKSFIDRDKYKQITMF